MGFVFGLIFSFLFWGAVWLMLYTFVPRVRSIFENGSIKIKEFFDGIANN